MYVYLITDYFALRTDTRTQINNLTAQIMLVIGGLNNYISANTFLSQNRASQRVSFDVKNDLASA